MSKSYHGQHGDSIIHQIWKQNQGRSLCTNHRLFLLPLTTWPSYLLLVSPALNQDCRNQGCSKPVPTSSFHTKNPRKLQTCSIQGPGYLSKRVTQYGENSVNPQGPGITLQLLKRAAWTSAREHCCVFLPMTINRNYYKQSIFVVFIKLYVYMFVHVHTCAQDHRACERHRSPSSRCWQVWTTNDLPVPTLT